MCCYQQIITKYLNERNQKIIRTNKHKTSEFVGKKKKKKTNMLNVSPNVGFFIDKR